MLSLPSKPSKRIRIVEKAKGTYTLTFISKIKNELVFEEIIKNDLEVCLGEHDRLSSPDWDNRSVELRTTDIKTFKQKLVFRPITIKK